MRYRTVGIFLLVALALASLMAPLAVEAQQAGEQTASDRVVNPWGTAAF